MEDKKDLFTDTLFRKFDNTDQKRIKILRIITRLNIGGPAIHAVLLTKELHNDAFESRLVCGTVSKGEGDMRYFAEMNNVTPIYISPLRRQINIFNDITAFFKILGCMRRYKPDIVHTHTAKAGALGRLAAILLRVPIKIHTFHGHVFHGYFSKLHTDFFIRIERILAKFTDIIIAISERQKEEIVNVYKITKPEKCTVMKLGFDLEKFLNNTEKSKNIFRKKFGFKDSDILVGIVGRLTSIKNHKMFIDAAWHVHSNTDKEALDRIKFVIIGDGEMKEDLKLYCRRRQLEKDIYFTGWIKDICSLYNDLDIVTLTSINEGTPVSLIEAMASSKPVISTNVGGLKDVVGSAGILVESGDYKMMGDKILELAGSLEKRNELGKRGRNFVKNNFSKDRLAFELEALYRKLVLQKRGIP